MVRIIDRKKTRCRKVTDDCVAVRTHNSENEENVNNDDTEKKEGP